MSFAPDHRKAIRVSDAQRLTMGKQEKLRQHREFQEIYQRGQRLHGPHLTIIYKPNNAEHSRLGIAVGKRRFKLSVRRHYIQRRLREAFRLNKGYFAPGYDIILRADRFDKQKISFAALQQELLILAKKAHLLIDNNN